MSILPQLPASDSLSALSPRDKPWNFHRFNAEEVANLFRIAGNESYANRIKDCAAWLRFALVPGEKEFRADDDTFWLKLRDARFCRVRHCPVCQWRRALLWRARFIKALPSICQAHKKDRWIFLTLTLRDPVMVELRSTITLMNRAWDRLVKRKAWPALGFARTLEVTRDRDGNPHPHFHCLMLVPRSYFDGHHYLSQLEWTQLWQKCLRVDYSPVVDIRAVKSKKTVAQTLMSDGIFRAACEVFKYSVKESDLVADPDWLQGLSEQLHQTRAIAIGGCLKQFLRDDDPEDLIHLEEESESESAVQTLMFTWIRQAYRLSLDLENEQIA